MMNRRTWIAGITVTSLLAALLTACKQEQREQEMRRKHSASCVFFSPLFLPTFVASL